jgi:hypothetical protein
MPDPVYGFPAPIAARIAAAGVGEWGSGGQVGRRRVLCGGNAIFFSFNCILTAFFKKGFLRETGVKRKKPLFKDRGDRI